MSDNINDINQLIEEIETECKIISLENEIRHKKYYSLKLKQRRKREFIDKLVARTVLGVSGVLVTLITFLYFATFSLKDKEKNEENLFANRGVIASEEEVDLICSSLEKELGISIPEEEQDDYLLLHAIKENKYLSESDKELFYQFADIFEENPYLNKEEVYCSLLNVDVSRKLKPFYIDDDTAGIHSSNYETIGIFDEEEQDVIMHEGVHTIFSSGQEDTLLRFFDEGMTELLSKEYYTKDPFVVDRYFYEVTLVKMLCEIVGSDLVLQSYTTGNMKIIYSELANYGGKDFEYAKNALLTISKDIDFVCEEDGNLSLKEDTRESLLFLDQCAANKTEMEDDYYFSSYLENKVLFWCMFSDVNNKALSARLNYYGYPNKAYFCEDLLTTGENKVMLKKQNK